jgi:hypothetical protein
MKNEVVIFCESYPQIVNTFYLITQYYPEHHVTVVITGNDNLLKLIQLINEKVFNNTLNIIFFKPYPAKMGQFCSRFIKALYLFPDIVREGLYIQAIFKRYFARLKGAEIYFSGICYNPYTYYMLKRLYRKNRITYMPDPTYDVVEIKKSFPRDIFELGIWIRYKLVFDVDLEIIQFPYQRSIAHMPYDFLRRHVKVINKEERNRLLKNFDMSRFRVFSEVDYRVLYFHQDAVILGYVSDAEAFIKTINEAYDIVSKYFPVDTIACKCHPDSKDMKMIKFGTILPVYIPAEFFYNDRTELYISIFSLALANVTKGLAVSLLDTLPFDNKETQERLKYELLKWSKKEILFPKSLAELEEILINMKKPNNAPKLKEAK